MRCEICGRELPKGRMKYCSRQCFEKARSQRREEGEEPQDINLPSAKYLEAQRQLLDLPENIKLSNLTFTTAGVILAYGLIIYLFTKSLHSGIFLHNEHIITYLHIAYATLLVIMGFAVRKDVSQITSGLVFVVVLIIVGQLVYAFTNSWIPVIIPICCNAYLAHSAWMIAKGDHEL
ncbi:hypothetical protein JW905_12585 [bacterium]|nr:hypothetical protein [candidate division CSSED10-310 bacterium]